MIPTFRCWIFLVALVGMRLGSLSAQSRQFPPSTTFPVEFVHSIDAGKAQPGMNVMARTRQAVLLPNGGSVPAGSLFLGHVVRSTAFAPPKTPYATAAPSTLSIRFDELRENGASTAVDLTVRAIAGPITSHQAEIPHFRDETDTVGTHILIGGETFSPLEEKLLSPSGSVVGFVRKQGVFARLLSAENDERDYMVKCTATLTEQSVDIFSADACGVYGLKTVSLHNAEDHEQGTFVLESRSQTVKLYAGSTALLQIRLP